MNKEKIFYTNDMVSIIIPIYNSVKYIEETLKSAINQLYLNMEIILIDDKSTESSDNIIQKYIKMYPDKIVYIKKECNEGVAATRNIGIEAARGRFLAFLDSDDVWSIDKLQSQVKLLNDKKCGFTYTALKYIDEDGNVIKDKVNVNKIMDYNGLLKNTMIATSSVVIDRNIVGEVKMPLMKIGEDYATWLLILKKGIVASGINSPMLMYRIHKNSLSSNKFESIKMLWNIQKHNENINAIKVIYNIFCYAIHAVKKHYF